MTGMTTGTLIQHYAEMKPTEFGPAIKPKWQLCERLLNEVQSSVEKEHVSPLDGARVVSAITKTLFGYEEPIPRDVYAESWFAAEGSDR
jgi:hypothetical protein